MDVTGCNAGKDARKSFGYKEHTALQLHSTAYNRAYLFPDVLLIA